MLHEDPASGKKKKKWSLYSSVIHCQHHRMVKLDQQSHFTDGEREAQRGCWKGDRGHTEQVNCRAEDRTLTSRPWCWHGMGKEEGDFMKEKPIWIQNWRARGLGWLSALNQGFRKGVRALSFQIERSTEKSTKPSRMICTFKLVSPVPKSPLCSRCQTAQRAAWYWERKENHQPPKSWLLL